MSSRMLRDALGNCSCQRAESMPCMFSIKIIDLLNKSTILQNKSMVLLRKSMILLSRPMNLLGNSIVLFGKSMDLPSNS